MLRNSTMFWALGVALAAGLGAPPSAKADANLNCHAYASNAVKQQNQNLANACGLAGIGWSGNYQAHFAWCRLPNVNITHVSRADRHRKTALAKCYRSKRRLNLKAKRKLNVGKAKDRLKKHQAKRDTFCGVYATEARQQYQDAVAKKCGFSGGRWSANVNTHRAWCLKVSEAAAKAESAHRVAALQGCSQGKLFSRPKTPVRSRPFGRLPVSECLSRKDLDLQNKRGRLFGCKRQIAADAFCRSKGYRRAHSFSMEVATSPSKGPLATTGSRPVAGFLKGRGYCGGQKCVYFNRIVCQGKT